MKDLNQPQCRCRYCDDNNVPLDKMAIVSFSKSLNKWAGCCMECWNDEKRIAASLEKKLSLGVYVEKP